MSPDVVGISPGDCHCRDRVPWFRALGDAGLRTLVLREPDLDEKHLDALVLQIWGVFPTVVLHDRHPLARRYGLPVHLPATGDPTGLPMPWSQSCHTAAQIERALEAGASWVTLSPVWRPTSKPDDDRPTLGIDGLLPFAHRPVLALGGVTPTRARALAERGIGAAVLGPLFTEDLDAASANCRALVEAYRPVSVSVDTPTSNRRSS